MAEATVVRRILKASGIHLADLALEVPDSIKAVVDGLFESLIVQLDSHALEDLLLAALESFVVPKGRRKFTEVYGLCFGTIRQCDELRDRTLKRVVHLSRIATEIRALATHESVTPNEQSAAIHLQVADQVFEHLELLGDYHTHPYPSFKSCVSQSGWELSDADRSQLKTWVQRLKLALRHPRFALVLAVSKADRTGRRFTQEAGNRIHVFVGRYSVHIAAYRLQSDGEADEHVELRVPMVGSSQL